VAQVRGLRRDLEQRARDGDGSEAWRAGRRGRQYVLDLREEEVAFAQLAL